MGLLQLEHLIMTTAVAPETTSNTTTSDPNDPSIPHPAYERMRPFWEKCRALMGGTQAIRDGAETYLPRLESESNESYDVRLNIAALYPGFSSVMKAAVGMLLQKPPAFGEDMPKPLVDIWENITATGVAGAVFCWDLVMSALVDGHSGIFVDYADVANPEKVDGDTEKRLGLRPYWIMFKADDIIKPVYETVNGRRRLGLLILRERVDERVGLFGIQTVSRYRVYTDQAGVIEFQLWESRDGVSKPVLTKAPKRMTGIGRIPWSPLRAGPKISEVETRPPANDLADLNIEYHQTKTNRLNLQQLAMVPTQVRIGASPDADGVYPPITLGPRSTIEAPAIQGVSQPVYWHSPDVTVLTPARESMEDTKGEMGSAGMAFLVPQARAAETATAHAIDATAQRADLSTVATGTEDCLGLAWQFTAEYMNIKAGSMTVNKDFENVIMDPTTMLAYVTAVRDAGLPIRLLLEAWLKGGRLKEGTDLDELEKEMAANMAANDMQKQLEEEERLRKIKEAGGVPDAE